MYFTERYLIAEPEKGSSIGYRSVKRIFFYRMATILKQKNREYILFRDGEHYGTGSVPGISSH